MPEEWAPWLGQEEDSVRHRLSLDFAITVLIVALVPFGWLYPLATSIWRATLTRPRRLQEVPVRRLTFW